MTETAEILFDPADPEVRRNPYPVYKRLQTEAPVWHAPWGTYYFSRYRDCFTLFRSPALSYDPFSSAAFLATLAEDPAERERQLKEFYLNRTVLEADPPEHTRLRSLFSKAFTPRSLADVGPVIDRLTDELLDGHDGPDIDLVADYAIVLPVRVICAMMGVPASEQPKFELLAAAMVRTVDPQTPVEERIAANKNLRDYIAALVEIRRQHPGDDLMSRLMEAADEGRLIGQDEMLANTGLLLAAGFETTASLITNAIYQLIQHPEERAALLAQPSLIRTAVEEALRYDPPTHMMRARTITGDVTIGGVELHPGDAVAPLLAAANRDPGEFDNPDTFDITRGVNRHMAFGLGHHMCVGAALARMEAQAMVLRIFQRFPDVHLTPGTTPVIRPHLSVRGFEKLPVTLW